MEETTTATKGRYNGNHSKEDNIAVSGRANIAVSGRTNIAVHERANIAVSGRANIAVNGRANLAVSGRANIAVNGSLSLFQVSRFPFAFFLFTRPVHAVSGKLINGSQTSILLKIAKQTTTTTKHEQTLPR